MPMSSVDVAAGQPVRPEWPDRECPVEECRQRFLNADTGGRHLDTAHNEAGRWSA